MMNHLRLTCLLLAAVLFGTAQAACACAPYQQTASQAHHKTEEFSGDHSVHAQHQDQSEHSNKQHNAAPAPDCGDGEPCGFHAVHMLSADTLAPSALTAPTKILALAPLATAPQIETPALSAVSGFPILDRAPPGPTPISLKVRLQN